MMRTTLALCSWLGLVVLCVLSGPAWAQEPDPSAAVRGNAPASSSISGADDDVPAPVRHDAGQVRNGLVLGASVGFGVSVIGNTGGSVGLPLPAPQAGLALGGKLGRVVLTIGAEFNNISFNNAMTPTLSGITTPTSTSTSNFLVLPGVQVACWRSHDGRVELVAAGRLGFGGPIVTSTPPPTSQSSNFNLMYEVGPGIRYWAHRHFAINLTTGFRGDYRFTTVNGSSTGSSMGSSTGINAIFVSLGGIGAF